jgi:DNA-binding transcriptional MerR regulator
LTGITARELEWWHERALIKRARKGHRRVYSLEDLTEVAMVRELRRKGFWFGKVLRFLREGVPEALAEAVSGSSNYDLFTEGCALDLGNLAVRDRRFTENSPPADVCHMPERHRSRNKALAGGGKRRSGPKKARSVRKAKFA